MVKRIGNIKLYSVEDLHKALGVNERTLRAWFNRGRLKGVKIGTSWHITEENLRRFLNAEEGGDSREKAKATKTKRKKKKGG